MSAATLIARITEYLGGGGLFNPEMAKHDALSELLVDCRRYLAQSQVPASEKLIEAGRLISMLSKTNGEPCDGFRFREGVLEIREALRLMGRLPFEKPAPADPASAGLGEALKEER
jgi:hypothetical protein